MIITPRLTELVVDFVHHRLPVATLTRSRSQLLELIASRMPGGVDVGERLEAILFSVRGGSVVIYEAGAIHLRFREVALADTQQVLMDLVGKLCEVFRWKKEHEIFDLEIDLHFEAVSSGNVNVAKVLTSFCDVSKLIRLCGIRNKPSGLGYSLLLSPLGVQDRDTRLRVAPLRREPREKYHLHISDYSARVPFAKVSILIDEAARTLANTARKLESKKR